MEERNKKFDALVGAVVNFVRLGPAVDINLLGGRNRERKYANLQIEADFEFVTGGKTYIIKPGNKDTLAPLLNVIDEKLSDIVYAEDEILALTFSGGDRLTVRPIPSYEAWTLTGDDLGYYVASGI